MDQASGKAQSITITNDKDRLSDEEIERMVNEAEAFAEVGLGLGLRFRLRVGFRRRVRLRRRVRVGMVNFRTLEGEGGRRGREEGR